MRQLTITTIATALLVVPAVAATGATQVASGCGTSVTEDHEDFVVEAEDCPEPTATTSTAPTETPRTRPVVDRPAG
ncbi:hypothetical protein [Janibacter anophelis]|uniref:hypothetical protein n=1 Tax=Janibacter anophelis TaxID=319054 RepID=UPI000AC89A5F|nr:hypothetical protein [Janibacter anophelis]